LTLLSVASDIRIRNDHVAFVFRTDRSQIVVFNEESEEDIFFLLICNSNFYL